MKVPDTVYIKNGSRAVANICYMEGSLKPKKGYAKYSRTNRNEKVPEWLARVWMVFDLSNGQCWEPKSEWNYVWFHLARDEARQHNREHKAKKNSATLSQPVKFYFEK